MASPNNIAQLPRVKPGRRGALSQVVDLQRLLFADANNPETSASVRAQIARAWCELEERKRILRMRPKPKDVVVEGPRGKMKGIAVEPVFFEPEAVADATSV